MADATIKDLVARRVWDSRGRPTVEAELHLADGSSGRAIAPAGASRGTHEAIELRDNEKAFGGHGVGKAVAVMRDLIRSALIGRRADDQKAIDECLIALDGTAQKSRLGGNAMIAVSMAAAHAAAASARVPLWRYLADGEAVHLPMPMVQLFGGGAHAGRRIDLQDLLIMPLGARSFEEAMEIAAEVYRAGGALMADLGRLRGVADEGGWWPEFASNEEALDRMMQAIERAGYRPGEDVAIAIDVAASQFGRDGRYRLAADGLDLDSAGLVARLTDWCKRYPIVSVEDPVAEDDDGGMRLFTAAVGERIQVIGDDYLVTAAERVRAAAARGACNAALIKPNQAGTLTETRAAFEAARAAGWRNVISARSGESEDVTIVHLAVGCRAEQLKVGSFARSERMAKWNEAIRVEQSLGAAAKFAGRRAIGGTGLDRTAAAQTTP
jgi:enolase